MPDPNIKLLTKDTLLKVLENSVGSKMFNSLIVQYQDSGEVQDVLEDGSKSCAFFVSSVLALLGLIDKPHATVKTTVEKLPEFGWKEAAGAIEPADIIVWEKMNFENGEEHEHIGFAVNDKEAVSTSYLERQVTRHLIDFGGKRKVIAVYRNESF